VQAKPVWQCQLAGASSKAELLKALDGADIGRSLLSDAKAQSAMLERIAAVEACNPSKRPCEDKNLPGPWEMIYTTSRSILGANRPGFLRPVELVQIISPDAFRITNIERAYPLGRGRGPVWVSTVTAKATPDGYSRVDVQFQRFQLFGGLLSFDVSKNKSFSGYLDTTYLDADMRISRGNEDNVFVLVRQSAK
jgi:hypothetical protein